MASSRVLDAAQSRRSANCVRNSASSPSDSSFTWRDHGIGASPDELHMPQTPPKSCGSPGGAPTSMSAYSTLSVTEAGSLETSRRSSTSTRQKRREMQLSAVAENFHAPDETAGETRRCPAKPAVATSLVGRQPCCRLKGSELCVVCGPGRAGPPLRPRAPRFRRRRGRHRGDDRARGGHGVGTDDLAEQAPWRWSPAPVA